MINEIFEAIIEAPLLHKPDGAVYKILKTQLRQEVDTLFMGEERVDRDFWKFGSLSLPFTRMGAITSLDLFGLDELILFAFYYRNRARYKQAVDIGANLGLHSMLMSRCGFAVQCFEPDPRHFQLLNENLTANRIETVEPIQAAVSIQAGKAQFVRVLGNTTGSHLAGVKDSYGEKEIFEVETRAIAPLFASADIAKIDAEGHERDLLLALTPETAANLDIVVEIGNAANAEAVFNHLKGHRIGMFAQKIGWETVTKLEHMPTSHRDGSLFISLKSEMPW